MDELRCRVEIRQDETVAGPGRISGTLLQYGERAADRAELFEPGALTWPSNGIVLRRQHARGAPIMRVQPEIPRFGRRDRCDAPGHVRRS